MGRREAVRIDLSDAERGELERRGRRRRIGHAEAVRAEIVLLAAAGRNNCDRTGGGRDAQDGPDVAKTVCRPSSRWA
ncbi:MAG TPA: hypothetical protein VFR34_02035 [Paracoccaceae bacterium]|nr:hypothetical protein [Paracoccaceae bacterium]